MSEPASPRGWWPAPDSPILGIPAGLLAAACLWALVVVFPGFFHNLELQAERLMLQRRGPEAPGPDEPRIVVVTQSDETYRWVEHHKGMRPGEWSRTVYAELLQRLRSLGVAAVGFDFVFDSEKPGTEAFAVALGKRPDNAVGAIWQVEVGSGRGAWKTTRYFKPLPVLEQASAVAGLRVPLDQDELVRRYFLTVDAGGGRSLPSMGYVLARLADPDLESRLADLPLDVDGAFLLDYPRPSPAFVEREMYRILDDEEFFDIRWRPVLGPADLGRDGAPGTQLEAGALSPGTLGLELVVSPPDLEVQVLARPRMGAPWAATSGRGRIRVEGLGEALYDLHVARDLGAGSWGILSAERVDPSSGPVELRFPDLAEPVEGTVRGGPPGARVELLSTGSPAGRGTYKERLVADLETGGRFRTPRSAEMEFFAAVDGNDAGPVLKSAGPAALEGGAAPAPPPPPGWLQVVGAPPGTRALVVANRLQLPPYGAQRVVGPDGRLEVEASAPEFQVLLEAPGGRRGVAAAPKENLFQGAVAVVGPTSALDQDFQATPFDHRSVLFGGPPGAAFRRTPGVEIHANALRGLLAGRHLRTPTGLDSMVAEGLATRIFGQLPLLLMMALLSAALGVAMMAAMPRGGWLVMLLGALAYEEVAFHRFASDRVWLHLVVPTLGLLTTYVVLLWYSYNTVERKRREIRNAFQHYLDPDIVKELERNPDALELGGTQQEVTCFFSDIEGFSGFSEIMTPRELVNFMNEYLTATSDLLLKYGGWIDKFIGDAIVGVFNAPRHQPDHAFRCVLAALEMKQKEAQLREEWAARGLPQVRTRIGINTGPAVVGNVGTEQKKNYTILGDAVNLAARLEALNKSYGTYLMIGENTYAQVKDRFDARELDLVRVKGKKLPAAVFQVFALAGEGGEAFARGRALWDRALAAYRAQDFDQAEGLYQKLVELDPEDGPSRMYLERISLLRKKPFPDGWDGVWTMEHK